MGIEFSLHYVHVPQSHVELLGMSWSRDAATQWRARGSNSPLLLSPCIARMDEKTLSVYKIDMAFGIYVLAELDITVALVYCRMVGATSMQRYTAILEARYLLERVEDINEIHLAMGRWKDLRPHIDKWLVEYSLNMWIENMNVNIGIAPAYDSVFEKYRALREEKKWQISSMIGGIFGKPG